MLPAVDASGLVQFVQHALRQALAPPQVPQADVVLHHRRPLADEVSAYRCIRALHFLPGRRQFSMEKL